jgi:hypothetical protein
MASTSEQPDIDPILQLLMYLQQSVGGCYQQHCSFVEARALDHCSAVFMSKFESKLTAQPLAVPFFHMPCL